MENIQDVLGVLYNFLTRYGLKLIGAIAVLIIGLIVVKWLTKLLVKGMRKGNVNESLIPFLKTLTNILLQVMLILSVPGLVGIRKTVLLTPDNRKVIIPNSPLATNSLINYSAMETRRIDFSFGIGYGDDIDKAKDILLKMAQDDNRILKEDNPPAVMVEALADSSVNLKLRVWLKSSDYWDVFFEYTEAVKKKFDAAGINIPFPQRDVHVYNHKA